MAATRSNIITPATVGSILTTLYTSPAAPALGTLVTYISAVNSHASDVDALTLYHVISGSTAGAANIIWPSTGIEAGTRQTVKISGTFLSPGDTIQALTTTGGSITIDAAGIEYT